LEGKRTVVANKFGARHFNKPNDLWIDPKGGIYFTDPQYGNNFHIVQDGQHIYYILPDRSKTIRVIETGEGKGFVKPNGIVGTPDGKLLYVADIDGRIVYRYNIQPDGTLTGKHPFASHPVDGMTIDEQGNVYLTALNQEDRNHVVIYNPEGKEIERIRIPEGPSNVCFGGKDFKTLFITAHTGFYAIEMNVRGVNPNRVPKIVKMFPENGAANVDPNISQVYLTFDMPMGSGRAWASNTADGTALDHDPEGGGVFWTADQLTCVATVKLQPNKRYVVYLNIRTYIGFASVAGVPSAGLTYSFETGSGPLDPERRNELAQNLHEKPEK
jgi:DNA-binding beta-propeller fold protein YncE